MQQIDTSKPELAPVPIWRCRNQECKAWVRDELAAGAAPGAGPECPLCKGPMLRGMKHLPKLVKKVKAPKKKAPEDAWLH